MTATIDILRAELERLFSLDELTQMSQNLLGLDPGEVGGGSAKGSFARALTERCVDGDRIEALVDVILVSRNEVDPRVRDIASLLGSDDLKPGATFGPYTIKKRVSTSELGIVYLAERDGNACTVKTLRREAARDRRAVHRFLTANRLVGTVKHTGLPKNIDAGESDGVFYVAYEHIDAPSLAMRLVRKGPSHLQDIVPVLRGVLEPLAALHKAHLVHGDLKLDHALMTNDAPNDPGIVLIDFGGDRLRPRLASMNGGAFGFLAVFGSPKTIAPEQVRGRGSDARTDVYSFGAMVYELLSGKPVFPVESPTDAAFAHVAVEPEAPSRKAPKGWIDAEIDEWVLSMLQKDPSARPRDAVALLERLERIGRTAPAKGGTARVSPARVGELLSTLGANPGDTDAAMALEKAVAEGADPSEVARGLFDAAQRFTPQSTDDVEKKKALLYRAGRIFDSSAGDRASAESVYLQLVELDPNDDISLGALETVRKALGKYEEILEMLLARSESAAHGADRGRLMAEIGRICAYELDDSEQALVAFTQAFAESPLEEEYATEIERLAGDNAQGWGEVLASVTQAVQSEAFGITERNALLERAGRWYDDKVGRLDMALAAYQQMLALDPASEVAHEGLTRIYRRAQQWPELAQVLVARADAAASGPRARDWRAEAADLFESKLNDPARARELYLAVLQDDPGHVQAGDALARIAERAGDFAELARILRSRAEARRGTERADALARVAEVHEDHLDDLDGATALFEEALAVDPTNLNALKGLDRVFNRTGRYRELLEVLEKQIAHAATPRQKINLYERLAGVHDEEFLDHHAAASAYEKILQIDPNNDNALTGLVRHYRALDRWEDVAKLYERHVEATTDDARRVELLMHLARTLAENVGSPDRATKAYERVLELSAGHAGALEALAHLKEVSGDAHAALSAIETLAEKAETPEAKSEQWIRAARLLEARGDLDGAIERYRRALEIHPKDVSAFASLRGLFAQRGDTSSVVALLERELGQTDGDLAKARLHAETARLYREQLGDAAKAESAARRALEIDSSNAIAVLVLGDLAYDAGRFVEATTHYESLASRVGALEKDDAVRALTRYMEATAKSAPVEPAPTSMVDSMPPSGGSIPVASTGRISVAPPSNPKMLAAAEALHRLAPQDASTLLRTAGVMRDHGDTEAAKQMYEQILSAHHKELTIQQKAEALQGMGEAMRRAGDLEGALIRLREAAQVDPTNTRVFVTLGKVYEAKDNWPEVLRAKKRQLDLSTGRERFELLIQIGDVFSKHLGDRSMAAKTFAAALEEQPDDRRVLTRLMQLYSEEKDWKKLVEVVLRLADFVDDPKQRAKYLQTAAIVSARQLGETEKAIEYFDKAIGHDPTLSKAIDEVVTLRRQKRDYDGIERLLKLRLDHAKATHDRATLTEVLDQLGELYHTCLNEPELAIDAYEAAQAFDPDDRKRIEKLAELYSADPEQYLDKAFQAQTQILRRNPYRVESYKLLRKMFTDARRADASWCLCQALSVLNLAEPDEERFYKRHRASNAAPAQAVLADDDWERLAHPDQDRLLTSVFAMIQPVIVRARTQPLEQTGYDPRFAVDITQSADPVVQTLYYAAGVLGLTAPPVFQNPNNQGGIDFVHAHVPGIVLGRRAPELGQGTQGIAFAIGRHLAYYRPGAYVRHLVPTGTGLKAWLFAAIKSIVPQFPVTPDVEGPVSEAMGQIQGAFQGMQRDHLASAVSKLLQGGGALDLKRWVGSVDLTADRVGMLLAHDLHIATEAVRSIEGSAIPVKDRMKELVLFTVSEEYIALRDKLGISIEAAS